MNRRELLLGVTMLTASLAHAQDEKTRQKRRWRVLVVIPETHLSQPKIPDPAAETKLCQQLIDADYKVIDQDRIKAIRYDEHVARIIKGGNDAELEAIKIGKRYTADIIVTGEAFSQQIATNTVETALGNVTQVICRARLELKAIRTDTGEKIWSDAIHKTGAPDGTTELASKIALEQAAEDIAERLLRKLNKLTLGKTQTIELVVQGITGGEAGGDLEEALAKVPGVLDVSPGHLDGSTYDLELEIDKASVKGFARLLVTHPELTKFKLKVEKSSGSKIVVEFGASSP